MAESGAKGRNTAKQRDTVAANGTGNSSMVVTGNPRQAVEQGRTDIAADPTAQKGRTTIADVVVAKIAGMAAREIPGIYELGGGAARAFRAIRERVPGAGRPSVAQGVSVEVGERQAAVDLVIVIEYGISIADVAQAARENIIDAVERMTGLEVVEVNIAVDDIHLPDFEDSLDSGESSQGRNLE